MATEVLKAAEADKTTEQRQVPSQLKRIATTFTVLVSSLIAAADRTPPVTAADPFQDRPTADASEETEAENKTAANKLLASLPPTFKVAENVYGDVEKCEEPGAKFLLIFLKA